MKKIEHGLKEKDTLSFQESFPQLHSWYRVERIRGKENGWLQNILHKKTLLSTKRNKIELNEWNNPSEKSAKIVNSRKGYQHPQQFQHLCVWEEVRHEILNESRSDRGSQEKGNALLAFVWQASDSLSSRLHIDSCRNLSQEKATYQQKLAARFFSKNATCVHSSGATEDVRSYKWWKWLLLQVIENGISAKVRMWFVRTILQYFEASILRARRIVRKEHSALESNN